MYTCQNIFQVVVGLPLGMSINTLELVSKLFIILFFLANGK